MQSAVVLVVVCALMAVASYGAGLAPLLVNLPTNKVRLISAAGAGILVSTALCVIIPEGVQTLFMSGQDPGKPLGFLLVLGFLVMFVLDQSPELISRLMSRRSNNGFISIDMSSLRFSQVSSTAGLDTGPSNPASPNESAHDRSTRLDPSLSTTIALIVHAASDGIALGSTSASDDMRLKIMVFFAILIHKAPSAFGFVSVLMRQGLGPIQIRKRLLMFSLAAPLTAVATFALLSVLISDPGSGSFGIWAGYLLLLSGGSFLYVAAHALQDVADDLGSLEMALTILGMLVPMLTLLVPEI